MTPFRWDEQTELAAALLVAGNLSQDAIAEKVGTTRRTLFAWRQNAEFQARVSEGLAEIRDEVRRLGIGTVERRVAALNDRWNRLRQVIEARADDPRMEGIPGASTGLLTVTQVKQVGMGPDARMVSLYGIDAPLLREIREVEKQAAIELGQWQIRVDTGAIDMHKVHDAMEKRAAQYEAAQARVAATNVRRASLGQEPIHDVDDCDENDD